MTNKTEGILESIKFVVENSHYVKINLKKAEEFCEYFNQEHIKHWINESPFDIRRLNPKDRLHFLLVFNAISFSYWGKPKWKIRFHNQEFDGAYGMIAALGRAIENKFLILDAKYLSNISESDFSKILEGNVQIPLFKERLNILREIGTVLIKKFDGDFVSLIKKANGDALELLKLIVENFPSFGDSSVYKEKKIYFYKRVQLLVSDICQTFNRHEFDDFKKITELTACADYKLPFVLRRLGILSYSKELAKTVDNQIQIDKGNNMETEIRANTIWAIDLIKKQLKKKIPDIESIHINDHLWLLGQIKSPDDKPYHLTRTTSY